MNTVLHLIETGGIGGAETVYLNLVRRLDPTRWRSIPVVPSEDWLYRQLAAAGASPLVMEEGKSISPYFLARLHALIRRENVTLIHSHLLGSTIRAGILSLSSNVPAIGTLHGTADLSPKERFRTVKTMILNNGLQRIVFVSETLRRFFLESLRLRPAIGAVIPNGIDTNRFAQESKRAMRAELAISEKDFVIGTVANSGRVKGLDVFLEVAAYLKPRLPGCRFVMVGDTTKGRGADIVQLRNRLGLKDDVILTGFREDVEDLLPAFDVYVLTSRSEGFSLSLVEAMAAGLPVVATKCGGPEDILKDRVTGILVENGSVEAIAHAIQHLRGSSGTRRDLGSAARSAVRERFTLDAQIKSYEKLYDEVALNNRH